MLDVLYTVIIYPITLVLEVVFFLAQNIFKVPGVSVLAISAAVSILCLPLYNVAEKWQQLERDTQKRLAPKIAKIKAVFKGDEQYLILSTFYRQNHYHPLYALRSSFGLLIQVPFFIAAYAYLSHLDALKGAHFLFFRDLGAPDALFFIRRFSVNVLPIAMTAINIIAGAIYTKGFPFKEKAQIYGMALIFLVLLYNSPAGLVIYWTANNVFSLLKSAYSRVPFRRKNQILGAAVSALCLAFSCFLLFRHHGDREMRLALTTAALFTGAAPWLIPAVMRSVKKLPFAAEKRTSGKAITPLFCLCCLVLWCLAGLFLPSMLVGSSPEEFAYLDNHGSPLYFIAVTASQALGLFVFWPLCFFGLFYRSSPRALCFVAVAIAAVALVDVFAFPSHYGMVSLSMVFEHGINDSRLSLFMNLLVLVAVIFAAVPVFYIKRQILTPLVLICALVLAGVSVKNITHIQSVFKTATAYHEEKPSITEVKPIVTFSRTGRNIVVIMLDRGTGAFVPFIFNKTPSLAERFEGFTFYPNTLSFNGYTRFGAPPLFGGYEYTPAALAARSDTPMVTKHNEALLLLPRIFADAGFAVTVTDPPYPNYSERDDLRIYGDYPGIKAFVTDGAYADLWLKEHAMTLQSQSVVLERNILLYSLLKVSPILFRGGIYLRGDWLSPTGHQFKLSLNAYSVLDLLPRLCATAPLGGNFTQGSALIMVNNTTHDPTMYQAPDYRFSLSVTDYGTGPYANEAEYHGNAASHHRLADWFDHLRAEGVYDNTRIILVADHGAQKSLVNSFDNFNPLLMVKDFDAHGPLKTDNTFMTNADTPFLALSGLVDPIVNPATGKEISADTIAAAKSAPLRIAINPDSDLTSLNLTSNDYYVHGNIFDRSNWEKVENK